MRKGLIIFLLFLLLGIVALYWFSRSYLRIGIQNSLVPGESVVISHLAPSSSTYVPYDIEPFVEKLSVPWSIVFTSQNRMLITQREGNIVEAINGVLKQDPIRTFPEISNVSEDGLMGMALDPNYENNAYVYVCYAYKDNGSMKDRIVRLTDKGNTLSDDVVLLDNIPAAQFHAGCRLKFGPDGKLYASTGDATNKSHPQDINSLGGKILRMNADGSIPQDNPFPNSYTYSYGHRNPQGFDWNPTSNTLIATEHGPSGSDGPGGGDEVNVIRKGQNYGWPIVSHERSKEGMVSPLLVFTPAVAPAAGMFYTGSVFPQFTNSFLFGLLRGEGIIQVVFEQNDPEKVASYTKIEGVSVGRIRDIVEGPDGYIYFSTSNRDGRGNPRSTDDTIYRMVPKQ